MSTLDQRPRRRRRTLARILGLPVAVLLVLGMAPPRPAQADLGLSFPVAVITVSSTYERVGTVHTFDGTASFGLELSQIQAWSWDFGDGTTASTATAGHAYSTPGLHTAVLTVTDQFGVTGTDSVLIATWDYPTAVLAATPATTGPAPLTVAFDASASTGAGWPLQSFGWAFGDGGTATGATASHTYPTPGQYVASLSISNQLGWGSSAFQTINVTEPMAPPRRLVATSPRRGVVRLTWANRMTTIHQTEIQRCSGARCTAFATVALVPSTATTHRDAGLRSGATLRYRIKVTDIAGTVGLSGVVSVKVR